MASVSLSLPTDYWETLQVSNQDIEFLHNHLFEIETPLTTKELVGVLVEGRLRHEQEMLLKDKKGSGVVYLPKNHYRKGDELAFPALNWKKGQVTEVRPGVNPEVDDFEVLRVVMEEGRERLFAAGLPDHRLNEDSDPKRDYGGLDLQMLLREFGANIERGLEVALQADDELVRIAGRWFPRALLVDVNLGHLNLAEAVLDMANGEPQPTANLLKDVELPEGVNPKLAEFSLNYALQEDPRFDEVGPAGQVLWCLQRLEPEEVRKIPLYLRYDPMEYDRSALTDEMLALEAQLDDELSDVETKPTEEEADEVGVSLIYPHWRAGTLPISARVRSFFPTAYESPRIRFTLVDGKTGDKMPAWVVRKSRYVYGLRDWYQSQELIPGSLIRVRHGDQPGEVVVEAQTHRSTRDWVRTVIVGADGGLVFALLKQVVTADFNERMAMAVPDVKAIDQIWIRESKKRQPFDQLVFDLMRELIKLNPQGNVHAQELYSVVNIVRRCPPAPLLYLLATQSEYTHVGDLHFHLPESVQEGG